MEIIINGGYLGCDSNTLDALLLTKNMKNIKGVLVDVRKTKDDVLVLSKYNDLKRNTLSNKKISDCNYFDLRKVKFPSHIFKYFIPTLREFLDKYDTSLKVFLRLYDIDDNYLNLLYNILVEYQYQYYYITDSDIKNSKLLEIGNICNNYIYLDKLNNYIDNDNMYIIVRNINKINNNETLFDNYFK